MERSQAIQKIDDELKEIEAAIKGFAAAPQDPQNWVKEDLERYLDLNRRHSELLQRLADLEWNRSQRMQG